MEKREVLEKLRVRNGQSSKIDYVEILFYCLTICLCCAAPTIHYY